MKSLVLSILVFPYCAFCNLIDLAQHEKQIFSQNGEDGILSKIFEVLEIDTGYCVEFGAGDGYIFSNSLQFRNIGWQSLLLDGTYENHSINLYKEWITRENILDIFNKHSVPTDLELLSIDIDSNDWYIWKELGKLYRPIVVIIEFNPACGLQEDFVIEYNPEQRWSGDSYYGASFTAYFNLGRHLGYSLVYATYLNAFFIRDDIIREKGLQFKNANIIGKLYVGPEKCANELKKMPHQSSRELLKNPD
jgi:hypothetical protein